MSEELLQNHLQILNTRAQFAKDAQGAQPNFLARAFAAVAGAVSANTLWAGRPRWYDIARIYTPTVDIEGIFAEDPLCAGLIFKAGEPYDDTPNGDAGCDKWFIDNSDWIDRTYNAKKLVGLYQVTNPARKSILQDLEWYKSLDIGTPAQQVQKWLQDDADTYSLLRSVKIGFTKILHPTIDDLVQMPTRGINLWSWDDERLWKQYGITPWNTPSNVVPDADLAECWGRLPQRFDKLVAWGVLPKSLRQVNYSAPWVLAYMHGYSSAMDVLDAWNASYYWSGTTVVTNLTDIAQNWLTKIADSYRPKSSFGKNTAMIQISGDYFKVPQFKTVTGGLSALDLNVWWDGWAGMKNYFPDNRLGDPGTTVTPPPPPPPTPVPVKKYFATVRQTAVGLKLRKTKQIGITTNILDADFRPIAQIPLISTPAVEGAITWAEMDYAGESAFFGVRQGTNDPYADVVEKTI